MSERTTDQLYRDVTTVNAQDPNENITANTASLYNTNLADARSKYPSNAFLKLLPEATKDTVYYDLLVMVGQFKEGITDANYENKSPRGTSFS